ncbi:MAG: aminotransferase class I/II-fold pyridoxal phosphate-dependent enzyme [candidate division WOR-3 bacterium]
MEKIFALRLNRIPPYLFSELDRLKAQLGRGLIDLGEGNPDLPPARALLARLRQALNQPANHRYPTYAGKLSVRTRVAEWYQQRFGVRLNPENEVLMLIGSKEGAAHLIWALCGDGDRVGVADPGYPVYFNNTLLAGATPVSIPLEEKNGFLPDLNLIDRLGPRLKLLCLNFPSNPTAAVAPLEFYHELIRLALRHGFYVINDNVYSELWFETPPPSILQVPDARSCAVELHSLAKTFSIPGWRIGMAVGNPDILKAVLKIKQNVDSGPFGAVQDAAAWALQNCRKLAEPVRHTYARRMKVFVQALQSAGWQLTPPRATFYLWARLPERWQHQANGSRSFAFVLALLENCRVVAAPGAGFGRHGEGYVRFALIADEKRLRTAARRIGRWLKTI